MTFSPFPSQFPRMVFAQGFGTVGAAGRLQTFAVISQVPAAMERPAFRNDIPQRVFLRVVNVAEHILRHPALQIPGGMPAHFRLLPGQVVGLVRIVFDVEQLFRRRQMVAVVVGSDIQVILKTNAALAYMPSAPVRTQSA